MRLNFLFLFFIFASSLARSLECPQCGSLEITVSGVRNSQGTLRVFLTTSKKNFEEKNPNKIQFSRAFFRSAKAQSEGNVFLFSQLEARLYAFKIFHDENDNKILDTNLLGKPLEGIFVSGYNDFKSPDYLFENARFEIPSMKKIKKQSVLSYL